MLRMNLIVIVVLTTIVLSSCSNDVVNSRIESPKGIDLGRYGLSVVDTIQALLVYHASDKIEDGSFWTSSNVQAYTYASDTLIDVSSVKVNSGSLQWESRGTYWQETPSVPTGTSTALAWEINGYLGGNFTHTFNMAPRMTLSNFSFGDTISASSGTTITYSGALSGANLEVDLVFDRASSEYWIHSDSTSGGGNFSKVISDAGSIVLTPGELSNLTPHRVYNLIFRHRVYTSVPYAGTKVGHYSVFSVDVPFVLVP